jgi:hypothetical protein
VDPRSRPQWPEAFFLLTHKTQLSCTLPDPRLILSSPKKSEVG